MVDNILISKLIVHNGEPMSFLAQMELFYFVTICNGFTRAALELGVSKAYVSTQISALEKSLKVKLLFRSTRHLTLTEEGAVFFESCTKVVQEKHCVLSLLKEHQTEASGHLKLTAPLSFCEGVLSELIPQFQKQFPNIALSIHSSSKVENLLRHGIDLAIRITTEPDENYVACIIKTFSNSLCATPTYLKQCPPLKNPDDLVQHNCLIYSSDPARHQWPFQIGGSIKIISVQGNLISENSTIIKSALLEHQGIARLPQYLLTQEKAEQKIRVLFEDNTNIQMPIYAIYANGMVPKKKFIALFPS